jgi:hypothetical protein
MKSKSAAKPWGIDLEGRKMWYEPWLVGGSGNYYVTSERRVDEQI